MTTGMSAREYLASIGKESALKSAPAGHRLDPLRADILALRNAGYTYRGIYEWLLEHKPMYADHVKATKSEATDITAIGNYVLRVERGEIGRKPGRPRKHLDATTKAALPSKATAPSAPENKEPNTAPTKPAAVARVSSPWTLGRKSAGSGAGTTAAEIAGTTEQEHIFGTKKLLK